MKKIVYWSLPLLGAVHWSLQAQTPIAEERLNLHWVGEGTTNTDGNLEWNDIANWYVNSNLWGINGGEESEYAASLSGDGIYHNIFLYGGSSYLSGLATTNRYQHIHDLTIVAGEVRIAGRYSTDAPDLRVDGDFLVKSGARFFLTAYSPNVVHFYGNFTAEENTILGNVSSTSDGGYWNLTNATAIHLQGTKLQQMTNNWQWGPQAWNFGTARMQLTNANTFDVVQDVVSAPRTGVDSRGSLQITVNNEIFGTGGITKTGDGTLILNSASNSYEGATRIEGGILYAKGGNAIGDNSAVFLSNHISNANGGSVKATLVLDADETIGSLEGGGTNGGNVILNGHTLTINGLTSKSFAGSIGGSATGALQGVRLNQSSPAAHSPFTPEGYMYAPTPSVGEGNLRKLGTTELTLSGVSYYTGYTEIAQGNLTITGNVRKGEASAIGQSSTALLLGSSATQSIGSIDNSVNVLTFLNNTSAAVNWVMERDIDASQVGTAVVGRTRIRIAGGPATDTSTLTISGDIMYRVGGGQRLEFSAQQVGQVLNITGAVSGSGGGLLINGSNTGDGTVRLANESNTFNMFTKVVRGTLIAVGNIGLANTASAIGYSGLELGVDGAPLSVTSVGGEKVIPSFFMETADTKMQRSISIGSVATYSGNNGVPNGYRIGGLNTTGTVEYTGAINSNSLANGNSNLALLSKEGGRVQFSGVINDNSHATNVTNVSINQFTHHEDLVTTGLAGTAYGAAEKGTVVLSGSNTYQGYTRVWSGSLLANNITGSATGLGDVKVYSGATLGGTGSIFGKTEIVADAGSFIRIGNEDGVKAQLTLGNIAQVSDVTIDLTSTMTFDLTGSGSFANLGDASYQNFDLANNDRLRLATSGNVDLSDSSIVLNVNGVAGDLGQTWKLIDWSLSEFDKVNVDNLSYLTSSYANYNFEYRVNHDGLYVQAVSFVPEPSRALLLGLAGLGMLWQRRRSS